MKFWIKVRDDENARTADRIKASECLSRHRGFFTDKKEISGNMAVNIVDDI